VDSHLKENFPYRDLTYKIIGAAQEVHKELGPGFLESVYQNALVLEFTQQHIPFQQESEIDIFYKGVKLDKKFFADFICYDKIIVELKALNKLSGDHQAQVLNYLKAANFKLGLLLNFGESSLKVKRLIST